jgi:putative DNA primase/helicase
MTMRTLNPITPAPNDNPNSSNEAAGGIPAELEKIPQWVGWKAEQRPGEEKARKVPKNPRTGRNAATNKPETWATYEQAQAAVKRNHLNGLGFVFTKEAGIAGVDLDGCIDESGRMAEWAQATIDQLDSYTELSPSGRGVHILVRGSVPAGLKTSQVEIYDCGRFFTITGKHLPTTPTSIQARQDELTALYHRHKTADKRQADKTALSDSELLALAHNAKNGAKFTGLWNGDTADYNGDESAADLALCCLLAFWTGKDTAAIDRLFRQSRLYRPKWDEKHAADGRSYGEMTIGRAIAQTKDVYDPTTTTNGESVEPAAGILRPTLLSDLLNQEFPPLIFLVDRLLAKGHLAVFGGRPKSGKSWLGLQMAQAIDSGQPFLGLDTRRGRVLYIALEDGERRVYQRCKEMKWQPARAAVSFQIPVFDGDGVPGPGVSQLWELVGKYDLIIIDTLIATLSGRADENNNTQMGVIMNELARFAHETDTAVLLVHHTGKGSSENIFDLLRGASAIRGGYDVGMILERRQDEREAILHLESRDVDVPNMTIRQADNGVGWECLGNGAEIFKIRAGKRVIKLMAEQGDGMTADELAAKLSISRQAVHSQLVKAERDGRVYRKSEQREHADKPVDVWYLKG